MEQTELTNGMWPSGCGYQGYEFGAGRYPDSLCVGGQLFDADACDDDHNLFEPMDYIPCPMCQPREARTYHKRQNILSTELTKRKAGKCARMLVYNIRKNRKQHTEPWRQAP